MNWLDTIISTYLLVCHFYEKKLWAYCQRLRNQSIIRYIPIFIEQLKA